MYLPGTCTRRVGIYFRAGLAMFVRMITASRFLFGSDRNKPQIKGVAQKPPRRFFRKIRVPQKTPELGFFAEPLFRKISRKMRVFCGTPSWVFLRNALYKPHEKTVDVCSVRLVRTEGGVLHFLGAQDSAVSAILRNR